MMKLQNLSALLVLALGGAMAANTRAQSATTQPTPNVAVAELNLRANQAMARGDYASALPVLQKVSGLLTDEPDQLGPILEEIRMCRRQIANAAKSAAANGSAAAPAVPVIGAPLAAPADNETRKPHDLPKPGQTLAIAIKDLGNFDFDAEKGGNIPDDVKKLEGCKFSTTGYMVPLDQAESISQFALVPSLFACCFGQPPQIQHTIVVQTPKGKAVSYFPDELVVEGTLHVSEQKDGGFIVSIFQMDATSVRPAAK
ncbi:MAG: DUF3299 domain-containing protein [Planctomycetota bacterium]|nr:DUF3299 domain-containing protein [Planctomycetota bacterium]